jgi:peptide methionine sulfoxide reductase MsrA
MARSWVRRSPAEDHHQQYLDKVPNGYCPNHSTGVTLPADFVVTPLQYVDR